MERVIYSPSIDFLIEAEKLAKITLLPILIGESETIKMLEFERNKVQVLKIPKVYFFGLNLGNVKKGFHQSVLLVDEFTSDFAHDYKLFLNNEEKIPMYNEKHKMKWSFRCATNGVNSVSLFFKNKKVEEVEFDVY